MEEPHSPKPRSKSSAMSTIANKWKQQQSSSSITSPSSITSSSSEDEQVDIVDSSNIESNDDLIHINSQNDNLDNDDLENEEKKIRFSYSAHNSLGNRMVIKSWVGLLSTNEYLTQESVYNLFSKLMRRKGIRQIPNLKAFKSHESFMKLKAKQLCEKVVNEPPENLLKIKQSILSHKLNFLLQESHKEAYKDFLRYGNHLLQLEEERTQNKQELDKSRKEKDEETKLVYDISGISKKQRTGNIHHPSNPNQAKSVYPTNSNDAIINKLQLIDKKVDLILELIKQKE